ncbi:hypothetical protein T265_04769 [Opisthorchis viverrini]|uniref:Uncharacterized protein n=1 Tax=Opisthorchis viverrini TaxID=6198 RepID=A0A074ZMN7_OPIVI|nr:hypothetical protein T265_04769 [Opisthorchis viverrini]KER28386.1 hypothetical protein T265_04769 [Opisthorchis viverrini]
MALVRSTRLPGFEPFNAMNLLRAERHAKWTRTGDRKEVVRDCRSFNIEAKARKKITKQEPLSRHVARCLRWLERGFTNRKVRGLNPTYAPQLFLSGLGQPGGIPALVLPSGSMAARHRKGVTDEQFF